MKSSGRNTERWYGNHAQAADRPFCDKPLLDTDRPGTFLQRNFPHYEITDEFAFSRYFKRNIGESPRAWKQSGNEKFNHIP